MLVVTRKTGESLIIGEDIEIIFLETGDGSVKIGINAPKNVKVLRKELVMEVKNQNLQSIDNIEKLLVKENRHSVQNK